MLLKDKFSAGREGGRKRKKERYGDMELDRLDDCLVHISFKSVVETLISALC